ncbi:hypothetical protein KBY22_06365 [Ruegeria pomeroyi]|uniref:HTH luxR-type domain-containing protein n=1 Tax=Ruegeria pomeroyi TaxID=89184 RepID=A0A9Q3ZNS9_9RHOB|nr:alpha/beta fold hydrolase [Ruegeria pomeroyi]MCE8512309.1 hypothetical protein [Ruegeria pomeroyi]MCE8537974.1 hypothetical protein [Ruegeria pomeroyi]
MDASPLETGKSEVGPDGTCPVPIRDLLIAAIYEAAINPNAYGSFVSALADYLEHSAVNAWKIRNLSEIDIDVIEADRGLALHFTNLKARLANQPNRIIPGSLRERISDRRGLAMLIDSKGRIVSTSHATCAALGVAQPNVDVLAGRLHADDAIQLRKAVTDHVVHGRYVGIRILRGDAFHIIARTLRCESDGENFLCLEALVVDWSEELENVLQTSFGLTSAELRVLQPLAFGESISAIALKFDRSEGTIRNQIKSILAKTEAGRIANLNRIVALVGETVAGAPALHSVPSDKVPELDILTLPDGRMLEVRKQGPKGGAPILFIHGMLFGSELPKIPMDHIEKLGIRLLAPARPHFGMSDPSPGVPENEPDRLVEDLVFVLDHFGIEKTVCLTNIVGSIYGYALAAAVPNRFSGLVHAASSIPVLKTKQFAAMPQTQRLIAFLMRFAPDLLPPLLQSGIAQIRAAGEQSFLATLYEEGTCDHAVAQRPELRDLLKRSVHFATDQGYLGAFTDTLHVVRDWSGYVQQVSAAGIPSIHVHGLEDPQYPIRDVIEFTKRFDNVHTRSVPEAGQLLLFEKPALVFEAVSTLLV